MHRSHRSCGSGGQRQKSTLILASHDVSAQQSPLRVTASRCLLADSVPKRKKRVEPPPAPPGWDLRYATSNATKGWEDVCSAAPNNARTSWERITPPIRDSETTASTLSRVRSVLARSTPGATPPLSRPRGYSTDAEPGLVGKDCQQVGVNGRPPGLGHLDVRSASGPMRVDQACRHSRSRCARSVRGGLRERDDAVPTVAARSGVNE